MVLFMVLLFYICMLHPWNGSMTTAKDSSGLL